MRFPTKILQGHKEKKMKNTINKEALKERLEKEGFEIKEELFDVLGLFIFEQFGIKETSKILDLTVKEFNLLFFLASHKGIIFTKKQIVIH